ncbi:unnamed protein product [Symbiodinium necroappetens]|uniref:Uncharacterized protein n=1 Tax=Symbiodinium necroappetens TaxID=1628268 RepID=A0A813C9F1_9DINO|nr:unnamed protein product [Symbiodinium necroappetens]
MAGARFVALLLACLLRQQVDCARIGGQSGSNQTVAEPVSIALGILGALGSVYSMQKSWQTIKRSKEQDLAATKLVQDMAETSREHCRLLSSIDAMLYNGQLGLEELLQNDAAEPEVRQACADEKRLEHMQDVMVRSLREECLHLERLFRPQGTARFPEQLAECRSQVATNFTYLECGQTALKDSWSRSLLSAKLKRYRLDAIMSSWCTADERKAPRATEASLDLKATSLGQGLRQSTQIGMFGLATATLGMVSFAFSLYESETNKKLGFDILSQYMQTWQTQQDARHRQLCQELTQHWLQASRIYAWGLAMRSDIYFESGLTEPMDPLDTDSWDRWPLERGSRWACSRPKQCLVPLTPNVVDVDPAYPKQLGEGCRSAKSYFRVCGDGGSVTAMVPLACFSASFDRRGRSREWTLSFRLRNPQPPGKFEDSNYNVQECEKPLIEFIDGHRAVAQARDNIKQVCSRAVL